MTNPYSMTQVLAQAHRAEVLQAVARARRQARRATRQDPRRRLREWWEGQLGRRRAGATTTACVAGR